MQSSVSGTLDAGFETTAAPSLATNPTQQDRPDIFAPSIPSSVNAPHAPAIAIEPTVPAPASHRDYSAGAHHEHFGSSSSSAFTGQIKAVINARSGGVSHPQTPAATPMVDVSLFPSAQDDAATAVMPNGLDYDLPPRRRADQLVQAYWSLLHPLFPVLSRIQFMSSYAALFAGTTIDTNERVLLSTLNVIFAMSVQMQESLEPLERERLSGKYFQRAHNLLPSPVWETGSIELIQCLLLMSQYLQCTNKSLQTWMVVGSAVRIAQGLGLHHAKIWDAPSPNENHALERRIWQSCITMDRYVDCGYLVSNSSHNS
jgi:hypothetical protein